MNFRDEDWRELFAHYRLEVIHAGFGSWDTAAMASLVGESSKDHFRTYSERFIQLLRARDPQQQKRLVAELAQLVTTLDRRPLEVAIEHEDGQASTTFGDVTEITELREPDTVAFQRFHDDLFGGGTPREGARQ